MTRTPTLATIRGPLRRAANAFPVVLTSLAFCLLVTATSSAEVPYSPALIRDVPHVRQKTDFCGEACVEMVLRKAGFSMDQDFVFDSSELDPSLCRGCYTPDLARAMKRIGFDAGAVWYSLGSDPTTNIESQWKALHSDLVKGVPSIVCTHFNGEPGAPEHFRLILGYDPTGDEVIYHDPALDKGSYLHMKRDQFLRLWPLRDGGAGQMVVRFRCRAVAVTNAVPPRGFTSADYAQHLMAMKKKGMLKGLTVVVEAPFVVLGDEPPDTVRFHAERTVQWAVKMLKQDYFRKNPAEIIDIWLFKDRASYESNTRELLHETPTTPFGFYSESNRALIMNIATGGGTLVHEIVHPFIRANFPDCPAWFNEGLGSLYEQSAERDGHIVGLTNWRLSGLQKRIAERGLPSFPALLKTSSGEFYSSNRGDNYAQARYLCYYLQERGLLVGFYRGFLASRADDPSGLQTLKKVLGEDDMDAFRRKWEAFVMKLTFP